MQALVTTGDGPFGLTLVEVEEPRPGPGEVVVEVAAVSVNRGELGLAATLPAGSRLGWDVAGRVVRAAEAGGGPPVGARVVGLVERVGWAERVAVPVGRLAEVPESVELADAAALPVAGLTAWYALRTAGWLLGRRVLVTGAAGGVGRYAVQLAATGGAEVVALVGASARAVGLSALGAVDVATYADTGVGSTPPWAPVDVLLDSAGGEVLAGALSHVGPGGAVVSFGNSSRAGLTVPFDFGRLRPGVRHHYLFLFDEANRRDVGRDLAALLQLVADKRLDPQIAAVGSWRNPGGILRSLADRRLNGKAVLTIGE